MFDTEVLDHDTPDRARQTYRRLVYGIAGVAILGLIAGMGLDQQLAGTAVYMVGVWIGGGIALLGPRMSGVTLQDERDTELYNRASGLTMGVLFVLGLSVVPAVYVLEAAGAVDMPPEVGGAIMLASALFLLWGVAFGIVKRR